MDYKNRLVDALSYTVTITTQQGCVLTDTTDVIAINCPTNIIIPNVFTPGSDGKNDYFKIQNLNGMQANLSVYNRWGIEVYKAQPYLNNWDGDNLNEGTYFYLVTLISEKNAVKYSGKLSIIKSE